MATSSERIRVVHIVTRMNTGGVAVLLANLIRNLDPRSFDVTLLVGECSRDEEDYLRVAAPDIRAIRIPSLQRAISPFNDVKALAQIAKTLVTLNPHIVHTHTSKAGLLGRLASFIFVTRAKRVHTYHGHLLEGYFSKWNVNFIIFTERVLARISRVLIAMGNQVKKDLLQVKIGKAKQYQVFFPGLESSKEIPKDQARIMLNLSQDDVYAIFVGRLTKIKRVDRFLDSVEILKGRNSKIRFLIAGDGELRGEVEERIAKMSLDVTLLGWQKDISLALSASDFMIQCSDNEAVPLVLIEAAQHGLPVIATNVGSVSDVVSDNSNGYLTDLSPIAIANSAEKLGNDPELRNFMGANGRVHSQEYFSLARMISDHEGLYRSLV